LFWRLGREPTERLLRESATSSTKESTQDAF